MNSGYLQDLEIGHVGEVILVPSFKFDFVFV